MSKGNKTEINKEELHNKSDELIYCSLRKCPHFDCIRHNANIPFGVIILRTKFNPDKNWNCKDIVKE